MRSGPAVFSLRLASTVQRHLLTVYSAAGDPEVAAATLIYELKLPLCPAPATQWFALRVSYTRQ